jgi:alkanesulfonate monooxygenase SsuD/methylene tetrahydromethanopterin reductase-like flavin-dependent oxidoreductase (luciferase family)
MKCAYCDQTATHQVRPDAHTAPVAIVCPKHADEARTITTGWLIEPLEVQEPETDQEWQDAVNAAHVLLLIEDARFYGLIAGGPVVDVERCEKILRDGAAQGITPQPGTVQEFVEAVGSMEYVPAPDELRSEPNRDRT